MANLVASTGTAIVGYTAAQQPLIDALAEGSRRVLASPGIPVDISDITLPYTPQAFSAPEHAYHAFHLLYGDAVLEPAEMKSSPK